MRFTPFTVNIAAFCRAPLDIASMEVDHVIPESLIESPELPKILRDLGRPDDFSINGFENWLPSCRRCNGEKSDIVFDPSPIIQVRLQNLAERKNKTKELTEQTASKRKISLALNTLARAHEQGSITDEQIAIVQPLVQFHQSNPARVENDAPVRLTSFYEVLSDDGLIRTVRGPYGVGGGPSDPSDAARCPSCGFAAFNGARCVMCGGMGDF